MRILPSGGGKRKLPIVSGAWISEVPLDQGVKAETFVQLAQEQQPSIGGDRGFAELDAKLGRGEAWGSGAGRGYFPPATLDGTLSRRRSRSTSAHVIDPDPTDPGCRGIDGSLAPPQGRGPDSERLGHLRRKVSSRPQLEHPPVATAVLMPVGCCHSPVLVLSPLSESSPKTSPERPQNEPTRQRGFIGIS
jgi:hypothetical protein